MTPPSQHWTHYLIITLQTIAAIYLATFCVAVFYIHHGEHWLIPSMLLGLLYAFTIIISIKRLINQLPMPLLMIAAPTLPLIILLLVLMLIPVLQWL